MVLSNGMKLALDWPGLALDLLGLALIDHFLEIGELILDRKVDLGLASDWHRIGSGLAKNGSVWPWIGVQFALSGDRVAWLCSSEWIRDHPMWWTCSMVKTVSGHGLA